MDEYLNSESSYQRLLSDYKKYGTLTIGVDFDSTLYDYHNVGKSYEQVRQLVRDLHAQGFRIIIWTANNDHEFIKKFLKDNNIPYEGINIDGIDLGWYSRKPFFTILLDDRSGLLQTYTELRRLLEEINKTDKTKTDE